jgi:hypothetical protein
MNNENERPLSTQGSANEQENQLGGTTNLSPDQLKQESGIANPSEDNPDRVENPDDLHEIQVDDDLNEPDPDELQPDSNDEENEVTTDEDNEDASANDADGNGGYPDQAAGLNS